MGYQLRRTGKQASKTRSVSESDKGEVPCVKLKSSPNLPYKRPRQRSQPVPATGGVEVSTQSHQIAVPDVPSKHLSLGHSSAFSSSSMENDYFLRVPGNFKNIRKSTEKDCVQRGTECDDDDDGSSGVFSDDADILDAESPRRIQKRTISPDTDIEAFGQKLLVKVKPGRNIESPKVVLENSVDENEPKPKRSRKHSSTTLDEKEKLMLSSWDLPESILKNYQRSGITSLFQWQLECLANEKVLAGKNLLYSAPTSAGKTLVSEILMIKRVLELGKKAIVVLPFKSLAMEKVQSLQRIFEGTGIRVEGFIGSISPSGGLKAVDIAVCTFEKANRLINDLLEEKKISEIGTLVVDELHMIGDSHRGFILELLLTKILYMTSIKNYSAENSLSRSEESSLKSKPYNIQVIGMSATLPNLGLLAGWLNAELYRTDFRPVPLNLRLKVKDTLYNEQLKPVRGVKTEEIPFDIDGDIDDIVRLSLETVLDGFSVLIFCPFKLSVEATARQIANNFQIIGSCSAPQYDVGEKLRNRLDSSRIKTVVEQLKQCPGGSDQVLLNTVRFGVGYHHADLTEENRDLVESAFKSGTLKVIVATTTLSAGVNLPARRVMIFTPPESYKNLLNTMTYHQMCGRAGRNGIDTTGESILICTSALQAQGVRVFKGQIPAVKSALLEDGTSRLTRALLEAIASKIASNTEDVMSFAKCTFLFHSLDSAGLYEPKELGIQNDVLIENCAKYLEDKSFIRIKKYKQEDKPDEYMPTQLGLACFAASLSVDDGITIYKELAKARKCLVLETDLHMIYQVTSLWDAKELKYNSLKNYCEIFGKLSASEKEVAKLVGIKEGFIHRAKIGTVSWKDASPTLLIYQRFFLALALADLVNEKSLDYVGAKFNLPKGYLQKLQQNASLFAGLVTTFCARLRWTNLEQLLRQFQDRLEFGGQRELGDLIKLDCLNGQRARILYDANLKTISELAAADPAQLEHILIKATPFNSNSQEGGESSIWTIDKEVLTEAEAAKKIVEDARVFLQAENLENYQLALGNAPKFCTARNFESLQVKLAPQQITPENTRCCDEEVTTLTQPGSFSSAEVVEKEEYNLIKESSSDTESSTISPALAENSGQAVSGDFNEICVQKTTVGIAKIKIRVVKSAEDISSTFFSENEMIGVGIKLVSHKKASGSFARQGVAARISCKNTTINDSVDLVESQLSMAIYNGFDTVWVLSFQNEEDSRVKENEQHSGNQLEKLFVKIEASRCALAVFDWKETIRNLLWHCGSQVLSKLPSGERIWDPRIAQWMWEFDHDNRDVSKNKLIKEYASKEDKVMSDSKLEKEVAEAIFAWKVMTVLKTKLLSRGLWNHFITTEMPYIVPHLLMELNGVGLNSSRLSKLKRVLQFQSAWLELNAFCIAGRQFDLGSPNSIEQILYRVLRLKRPAGKGGTSKNVLIKLDHDLPRIIIEWRKVTKALQKVKPFQQEGNMRRGRVHGRYSHFTVTGRVVMSEPSLQCTQRDFDIQLSYDSKELDDLKNYCKTKFGTKLTALFQQLDSNVVDAYLVNNMSTVSIRNTLVPYSSDFILLTADYSLLELRILAHLSRDVKLLADLNKGTDVFIEIASQLYKVPQSQVTNSMRQDAKTIVYGVIYGLSSKGLSDDMQIDKKEADYFISQFWRTYPGVKSFTEKVSKCCQEKGYVETMTGRRRYFPSQYSPDRDKADRQATNYLIQGCAADLVKTATIRIHSFLQSKYPKSAKPVDWKNVRDHAQTSSLHDQASKTPLENFVFFPILNLHDELMFEVRKTHLREVANIVKREMESCVKLDVKLPVVIKVGESWGTMKVYSGD